MFYENVSDVIAKPVSSHNAHSRQITDSDYTYEAISSYNIKSFSDTSLLPLEVFEKQLLLIANTLLS